MSLKLGKLVFFLMIYIHCYGCLWFLIVKGNQEWIPPLDYVWIETNIYEDSVQMQYWMAFYHSVLVLTGGDIGPRGPFQLAVTAIFLTIGAIINANIFGELAVLVSALNRKNSRFQE